MEKKTISRFLSLYLASFLVLSVIGSFFRLVPVRASAVSDSPSFVTLTYEQTLALYGQSFDVTYYRLNQNDTVSCKAYYCGTTENYCPTSSLDDLSFKSKVFFPVDYSGNQIGSDEYGQGGLVYAICAASPAGGGLSIPFTSWQTSNTGDHANVSIDFPITFTGISRFVQPFFWTIGNYAQQADRSSLSFTTSLGLYTTTPARAAPSGTSYQRFGYGVGSLYYQNNPRFSSWSDVPERLLMNFGLLYSDIGESDYSTVFDVSAMHFSLNNVQALSVEGSGDFGFYDNFGGVSFAIDGYVPFIIIGRPKIYGYVPPETTTAPATTRDPSGVGVGTAVPYVTPEPVNLSTLESGVQAIVGEQIDANANLDWIGRNIYTSTNNLAYICDMLDKIYAKMVASGEIAWNPQLQTGLQPSFYGTDVRSDMESIIAGHTTATVPTNINTQFVKSAFSYIWEEIPFACYLGGLSLVLSVASWVIFKGRG